MTYKESLAHKIVIKAVNRLIELTASPEDVEVIAVCRNPTQLSLFTNGELRDLIYSPDALLRKGISIPKREAQILDGRAIGVNVPCDVLVPPSIKAEVGADGVAMIMKSGLRHESQAAAIDFGTNAEMAVKSGGSIFVGSAAAGPAIEGQHISRGMLAAPGAICDLEYDWGWRCKVLDESMVPQDGDTLDLKSGAMIKKGNLRAAGLIDLAFDEGDLLEAGKAFAAIRAGEETLAEAAGVDLRGVETCFLSGAAGTFSDPVKVLDLGLISAGTKNAHQIDNTSLQMACDLVSGKETLQEMQKIADQAVHVSFSRSETFKENYLREYAFWCEGARYPGRVIGPAEVAQEMRIFRAPELRAEKPVQYFRPDYCIPGSKSQERAALVCPRGALMLRESGFELDLGRCLGASCLRCERAGFRLGGTRAETSAGASFQIPFIAQHRTQGHVSLRSKAPIISLTVKSSRFSLK
jgi:uncharacterized 2Fe-2S/4Fe-4S cluster protein (DUF4445 family)